MRLGDLDALSAFVGDLRSTLHKEQSTFKAMKQSEFEIKDNMLLNFQYAIDNAPTVECVALTEEAYSDLCLRASRERPHGGWIEENSETGAIGITYTWVRCNQCGWNNSLVIPKNFCPNCGADMRGEE